MSPVIILGLVLMWAVVLIPMWLRRHDEAEESRSVDRFTAAMHTLSRRELKDAEDRSTVMPHRSRGVEVHVSGAAAPEELMPRRRPAAPVRVTAAQRRRRTLLSLATLAFVFLIAAVFTGSLILWVFEVMVDLAMVAFVVHLRRMAILTASMRSRRPAPTRRVVTEAPPASRPGMSTAERQQQRRWEHQRTDVGYGEQVVVRRDSDRLVESYEELPRYADASFVKAHRAEAKYDETRTAARYVEPEPQTAAFDRASVVEREAVFDQTASLEAPVSEPVPAAFDGFFDQETYIEPVVEAPAAVVEEPVAPEPSYARYSGPGFIEAGALRGRRDIDEEPVSKPAPAPAPAAKAAPERVVEAPIEPVTTVGGTPWEPVPVPRPTYTMKPAAPPRRPRYEPDEPLLPPVEPVAELDEAAELEEILDRRWAVND